MAFVIAEPCIGVKDTACVSACPVDCIHPRRDEADFETGAMLLSTQSSVLIAAPASLCVRYRRFMPKVMSVSDESTS